MKTKNRGFTRLNFTPKNFGGFTIVELLVVIVVIGILAAITIVSYTGLSSKATVASLQSDLSNAKKQLALYQVENSAFPTSMPLSNGRYCPNGSEDSKYCIKPSSDTTFVYSANNSNATPTFNLLATKNSTKYNVTNSSQPSLVTPAVATGGNNVTTDGRYRVHTFTSSGTLIVTTPGTAEVLVVGGGGGGSAGGGGAGGYLTGTETLTGTMSVTVGSGGIRGQPFYLSIPTNGSNGGDSSFGIRTAAGGGGGGGASLSGSSGGSGGGAGYGAGGSGGANSPTNQGYTGGSSIGGGWPSPAAGGGGIGGLGGNTPNQNQGGNGGPGLNNDIISRGVYVGYAGGGAGKGWGAVDGIASHGGGSTESSGTSNTGGGGGGAGGTSVDPYRAAGGNGGSGIVIIRYLIP
jgi:prepilin-type N-terminal cleavage/methylation domain-containing protein